MTLPGLVTGGWLQGRDFDIDPAISRFAGRIVSRQELAGLARALHHNQGSGVKLSTDGYLLAAERRDRSGMMTFRHRMLDELNEKVAS